MTEALTPPPEPAEPAADPRADTLEALEGALDALREHHPQRVPQWEYCEGVLTALLCMRRTVPPTGSRTAAKARAPLPLFSAPDEATGGISRALRSSDCTRFMSTGSETGSPVHQRARATGDRRLLGNGRVDFTWWIHRQPSDWATRS